MDVSVRKECNGVQRGDNLKNMCDRNVQAQQNHNKKV